MFFPISLSLPLSLLLLSILFLIYGIKTILLPPSKLTRPNPQIQVIPMWVSISPLLRRILRLPMLGQDEHFKRYIQPRMKNGAAWIFFASRWNLLVADPASIHRLLSTETRRNPGQGFHKVGNHLKIPQAVISQLTGSNIISEYGEVSSSFCGSAQDGHSSLIPFWPILSPKFCLTILSSPQSTTTLRHGRNIEK